MQVQPRAPQDFTLISDGTSSSSSSTGYRMITMSSGSPVFVTLTCSPSATNSDCPDPSYGAPRQEFPDQIVWGTTIATVTVIAFLVFIIICFKRRVRRRNRERVRALLWELVQAAQEGRFNETWLQQALYGANPASMELTPPVMYELYLDGSTPFDSKSKSIVLESSSSARWDTLSPLSISHPRELSTNLPKIRNSVSRTRSSVRKKSQTQFLEDQMDVSVLVAMPHEHKQLVFHFQPTSSPRLATTDSNSLTIATALPTFYGDPNNPIVPIKRPRRKANPLSSLDALSRARRANREASPGHPLTRIGSNITNR